MVFVPRENDFKRAEAGYSPVKYRIAMIQWYCYQTGGCETHIRRIIITDMNHEISEENQYSGKPNKEKIQLTYQ